MLIEDPHNTLATHPKSLKLNKLCLKGSGNRVTYTPSIQFV